MPVESGRNITIAISPDGTNTTSTSWLTIGQQRSGSVERTSETADATHKGTAGGWATSAFTRRTWSISFDGVLDNTDAGWDKLYNVWTSNTTTYFKIDGSALTSESIITQSGSAWITSLSFEFPESDIVSYSAELQGDGALSDITA